ncbi:hypothetical protein [Paraliomyxa miuraensis]|uniref:hypothetical protein n=1 Tax=Paraliomyxa miuraensis TaxID=376150 RepID=UPI002253EB8D|nr:hypothetical protein [Paraliomyxa miuraensis]MCX4240629.1 hypothetical protein [Paraliomyxa miuraensis]
MQTHLHHDPLWSMVVVFGVNLALPLILALAFAIAGARRGGDQRGAYLQLARWSVVVCVVMQLLCVGYHARRLLGSAEQGTVTQKEEVVESRYPKCELTLQSAQGELELTVPQGDCRGLEPGTTVPIITVSGTTTFAQVGEAATAHAGLTLGLGPLMILLIAWLLVRGPSREG